MKDDSLYFVPEGFVVRKNEIDNAEYRIKTYGEELPEITEWFKNRLGELKKMPEPIGTDIKALLRHN